jgi:surfeit locus 1 family protein
VTALLCARLGIWQVSRLRERRAANVVARQARSAPPVELTTDQPDSTLAGRRVRAVGSYDHAHDIVVRGRVYQGVPGVEIISPLILADKKTAVLVDRGFVPAPDAVTVVPDSFRESGTREVQGYLVPVPSGGGKPLQRRGITTWSRLDLTALRARLPYSVYPWSILQSPDSSLPRFPRRQAPPPLDDGPHLSYAIQWFSFAIIALVFAAVVARSSRRGQQNGPADL